MYESNALKNLTQHKTHTISLLVFVFIYVSLKKGEVSTLKEEEKTLHHKKGFFFSRNTGFHEEMFSLQGSGP